MDQQFPIPKMELITGEHCLQEIRSDLDEMYRSKSYRENFSPSYIELQDLVQKDTWKNENFILRNASGFPVGVMQPALDRSDGRVCNLRPQVFPRFQGQGYGTYMICWAIRNYIIEQGFISIGTTVWTTNEVSLKLNHKWMIHEGIRRKYVRINGVHVDAHVFSINKDDITKEKYAAINLVLSKSLRGGPNLVAREGL